MCVVNEKGKPAFNPQKHLPEFLKTAKGCFEKMMTTPCEGKGKQAPKMEEVFKDMSKFMDPKQFGEIEKCVGFNPMAFFHKMAKKAQKKDNGEKNFCKMMKQGRKFFKKFMKNHCGGQKKSQNKCGFPFMPGMGMMRCPWMKKMNKCWNGKKDSTPGVNPVWRMSPEEQLEYAKKLSMGAPKDTVKVTPAQETHPNPVWKLSPEEQLEYAMKLSMEAPKPTEDKLNETSKTDETQLPAETKTTPKE